MKRVKTILTIIGCVILLVLMGYGIWEISEINCDEGKSVGFVFSDELSNDQKISKYEKLGKRYAKKYIKKKYGFTPSVEDVYVHNDYWLGGDTVSSWVDVKLKYRDREFYVLLDVEDEENDICDNYQYNEIVTGIENVINEINGNQESIMVYYGDSYDAAASDMDKLIEQSGMIHEYYDGTNLANLFSADDRLIVSYIGDSTLGIDENYIKQKLGNMTVMLVNFRDKECFDDVYLPNYFMGTALDENAEYDMFEISDYTLIQSNKDIIRKSNIIGKSDKFEYVYANGTYCNFSEIIIDASMWDNADFLDDDGRFHPYELKKADQVFPAYEIDTDATEICIHVDSNKLIRNNFQHPMLGLNYKITTDEYFYKIKEVYMADDYSEIEFTFNIKNKSDVTWALFADVSDAFEQFQYTFEHKIDESLKKEYAILTGTGSFGTTWSYETEKFDIKQVDCVEKIGESDRRIYINEGGKIVALDKESGKIDWQNDEYKDGGSVSYINFEGMIYIMGQMNSTLFIYDFDEVIRKVGPFDGCSNPIKITVEGDFVTIEFENGNTVIYDMYEEIYEIKNKN